MKNVSGSTLIGLLAVALIAGSMAFVVLVVLVFSPVVAQHSSELARREQTKKNLKQLAIALHNYHAAE